MISTIVKHRSISIAALVSILLVLGGFFWAYGVIGPGAGVGFAAPLILHFNDMDGITAVGTFTDLIFMAVVGLVMVVINVFTAYILEGRDPVLAKIMLAAGLTIAVLLFIAFTAIINVN